ncbi:MAG: carboxypeptidase regulatory-like domain-containing protein [Planctomycetes bacterium]|nr:carboxypeptidase regulatory-like domain-containing protein [Planctomycetota bacterium]
MSPRTGSPGLLVALAVTAGAVAFGVWWVAPGGDLRAVAAVDRDATTFAGRTTERAGLELAAARAAPERVSTVTSADEVPCLEPGHCSITGRIVAADGTPVADARVAILAAPHAPDGLAVRGETRVDALGRFDVRTAQPGDVWLVAWKPGLRPSLRRLAVDEGFVELAESLELGPGVGLEGRVLASGAPLARVELEAAVPRHARRVRIGEDELALLDGALEWATPRSITAEDGSWSFRGLAPGPRIVRPYAFRCPNAVLPPSALSPATLGAPARGVDLLIPSARLALAIVADGAPVPWAEVEVEYRGVRGLRRADPRGQLELDVMPGEVLALVVRAHRRVPRREVVNALRRGERRELQVAAGAPAPVPGSQAPMIWRDK